MVPLFPYSDIDGNDLGIWEIKYAHIVAFYICLQLTNFASGSGDISPTTEVSTSKRCPSRTD